ncbi:MAG: glutathione peroxidase [Bacteroidota bacterium]
MKLLLTFVSLLSSCFGANNVKTRPDTMDALANPAKSFYDFKMLSLDEKPVDFAQFKGKKVLIINVASKCGYTPQYADWEKFHEEYGDKVVVIGVPANNFGSQEPGTNTEIATFCQKNYGVKFLMLEKVSVKGKDQHPLYQWLSKKELNGWNTDEPSWNFCKYLIDEKGALVKFFASAIKPTDPAFLAAIK